MQLTPEQQAFITEVQTTKNSIRLDAVAGSGKTTTLLAAAQSMDPSERCVALAFNKKIQEVLAEKFPPHVVCKTFNGLGSQVWTKFRGRVKLDTRKMGNITSEVCKERDLGDEWHAILAYANQLKKSGIIHRETAEFNKYPGTTPDTDTLLALEAHHDLSSNQEIVNAAFEVLKRSHAESKLKRIDFDDQLYMSTYFADDRYWPTFDTILVDESQDLSGVQHDMIERMMHKDTRLIIVGDKYQAIYGWRGADSDSMDKLEARYGLKKMPLTVCFRCPPEVVEVAAKIVPEIKPFQSKEPGAVIRLGTEWDPANLKLGSVVLCRNNAPLVAMAFGLLGLNIPAYFSGRNLGAGLKKTVDKLPSGPLGEALVHWKDLEVKLALANQQFDKADQIEDTFDTLTCIRVNAESKDKRALKTDIDYLFRKEYSEDAIELSTIHRAKGKEWDTVYFLNQHLIPGRWIKKALDEEKECAGWMMAQEWNLKYVAITRALKELIFIDKKRSGSNGD